MQESKESIRTKAKTGNLDQKEILRIKQGTERAELLANLLDDKMLDPILGLFEGAGDTASAIAGFYILYEAHKAGVPYLTLAKMLGRQTLDLTGGSVPFVGDIFDFAYKSNKKNAAELREHFKQIEMLNTKKNLKNLKKPEK